MFIKFKNQKETQDRINVNNITSYWKGECYIHINVLNGYMKIEFPTDKEAIEAFKDLDAFIIYCIGIKEI